MSDIADELRERTLSYALRILPFCRRLPDQWECRELGRQLLRAGMGVAGNYWSACRGRSDRAFIAKLGVAADEADESVLWLTMVIRGGIRDDAATKDCFRKDVNYGRSSQGPTRPLERIAVGRSRRRK
jgi:four helix bundle protein